MSLSATNTSSVVPTAPSVVTAPAFNSDVKFSILPGPGSSNKEYTLRVEFSPSSSSSAISPLDVIFQRATEDSKGRWVDIASVNAKTRSKDNETIKNAFGKNDFEDITTALKYTADERNKTNTQTVAVFDLQRKGPSYGYGNLKEIETAEKLIINRLTAASSQGSSTIDKVRQCFIDNNVVLMIREGSLKAKILESPLLKPEHRDFFQAHGHGQAFCQFTEFFMNAIKFGDQIITDPSLPLDTYMTSLQEGCTATPHPTSIVVYPPDYYDMAKNGEYSKAMKSADKIFASNFEYKDDKYIIGRFSPKI